MNEKKRTVILFNPRAMRGVGEDSIPPIGLLMAAIHLHEKYDVVIIDQRVEKDWKALLEDLLSKNPVCLGISALTGKQIEWALRASEIAKKRGCPVVWGGIHASLLPAQTLMHPFVDYVVQGEGEESFPELLEALVDGRSCEKIPGIWSKKDGAPVFGGVRPFVDIMKLPPVPYHLVDLNRYIKPGPHGKTIVFFTSRGCPQRCTFCFNHTFNQSRWRAFSPERVMEDIRRIQSEHPDVAHFEFWDDDFFVNLARAKKIAEGITKLDLPITWSVLGAHVREVTLMDEAYLAVLKESRLKGLIVGVEAGSQKMIDIIQKNFKLDELFAINRKLYDFHITPTYSFISGIPGEDDEDIKKSIEVMFRLKRENPEAVVGNIKPFVCYPGTALYAKMTEQGFRPPQKLEDWIDYVWGNYMNLDVPWVSKERRRFLSWLYYYTVLMNPTYIFIRSRMFTVIARLLKPLAEWRVKNFCMKFPVEAQLMYLAQRFVL
ncbi:MAG: radical SAM protein [Candidatus Omnitrophota bacterium]